MASTTIQIGHPQVGDLGQELSTNCVSPEHGVVIMAVEPTRHHVRLRGQPDAHVLATIRSRQFVMISEQACSAPRIEGSGSRSRECRHVLD